MGDELLMVQHDGLVHAGDVGGGGAAGRQPADVVVATQKGLDLNAGWIR